MTDTTPTPADRPADQLRAAADRARELGDTLHTELGNWLEATAHRLDASTHPDWQWAVVEPSALAVARQLLGTNVAEGATTVLEPQDHPGADLFVALQHAGLDVDEANRRMYAYARMVLRQEKAITAPPAPADRAAHYREAADIAESLREFNSPSLARNAAQVSENVGILRVADRLRRLAADAAAGVQPPTTGAPVHEHTWVTALDGDDCPARNEAGRTWTHCGICGQPKTPAAPTTPRDLTARWDEATGKPTPLCPCGYVPVACDADRGPTTPAAPAAPEEPQ